MPWKTVDQGVWRFYPKSFDSRYASTNFPPRQLDKRARVQVWVDEEAEQGGKDGA